MTVRDIAWLAGLLEGEGCFFIAKRHTNARVVLGMTDADIVQRAAAMVGNPAVYTRRQQNPKHKTQYWWVLHGHRAIGLMFTIYSFMGERRKAKIRECVAVWREKPLKQKPSGTGIITNCKHVTRVHYAHGICRPCYVGKQAQGEYRDEQLPRPA